SKRDWSSDVCSSDLRHPVKAHRVGKGSYAEWIGDSVHRVVGVMERTGISVSGNLTTMRGKVVRERCTAGMKCDSTLIKSFQYTYDHAGNLPSVTLANASMASYM